MKLIQRQLLYFAAGVITTLTLMTIPRIFLETEQPHVNRRKKVVFFGDSITQHGFNCARSGWVSAMADWWTRRVDVLNRGFSGYNSRWGLKMLEVVILPEKPDLLTVFFGANDAIDQSVLQYVSLDEYKKNVKNIVAVVRQKLPSTTIILITPPPVWEPKLEEMNIMKGKKLARDRTNQRTLEYVQACLEVAASWDLPVVDLWIGLEGNTDNRQHYLLDGLHLNERGNKRLFELLTNTIRNNFPSWTPEQMKLHMPEWSAVDPKNPKFA